MAERTPAYIPEDRIQNIEFSVDSLDSVLSDLKDGFSGLDRPTCHSCKHEIVEKEKLQVKTRFFHKKCFICTKCKVEFGTEKPFIEFTGNYYCEGCHQKEVGAFCIKCNEIIFDQALSALNAKWHPKCFVCCECSMAIFSAVDGGKYAEKDGKPYCIADYERLFVPKCSSCQLSIKDVAVKFNEKTFHNDCFKCGKCKQRIGNEKFYFHENIISCLACK